MASLWGKDRTRQEILARVGSINQIAAIKPWELTDGAERGCRGALITNGSGLAFTVLADRGMGIGDLWYHGVPIPFRTPAGDVNPAFADHRGAEWTRTWPGGFCTPCGLTQVGSACSDDGEELGLHGRVGALPAFEVAHGGTWTDDSTYVLWMEGKMRQSRLFGENILFTRSIRTRLGDAVFTIEDRFTNEGISSTPHMFLQHFNLGFPFVDEGTRLLLPPRETHARDDAAEAGLDTCTVMDTPDPSYQEQVLYHHLEADEHGKVAIAVVNDKFNGGEGLGIAFSYHQNHYPMLVQWKSMRSGAYALGIEPSNCHVEGRSSERAKGTLKMLEPGESRMYRIDIAFVAGDDSRALSDAFTAEGS